MNLSYINNVLTNTDAKIHIFYRKTTKNGLFLKKVKSIRFFNNRHLADFLIVMKKLQKRAKKSRKKKYNVLKKYLPLQRFNKQIEILQI